MDKLPFREYHLLQLLHLIEEKKPLDETVNLYFREHKALGSKDRKEIGDTLYGIVRWQESLDYLLEPPITWEKRVEIFKTFNPQESSLPKHLKVGFKEEAYEILYRSLEEKTDEFCKISNTQSPITIRLNPEKTTCEEFSRRFPQSRKCERAPFGFTFPKREPFTSYQEYKNGLFELQDEGSQLLAELVDAKPFDSVLDYCAGAAGKTLAFAYKLQKKGQLFLHDIRENALFEAKKRLLRAGVQMAHIGLPNPSTMDFVLVDVPCSQTGTLRRDPKQKERLNKAFVNALVLKQREIFKRALTYLKPSGKIIYATCSVLKEENNQQIDYFLKNYPLKLASPPFQSFPEEGGMDGFYGAILQFNTDYPIIPLS